MPSAPPPPPSAAAPAAPAPATEAPAIATPEAGVAAPRPSPPPAPRRRPGRLGRALLALGLSAGAAVAGLGQWVWHTEAGSRWALAQLPGLHASGLRGALGDERSQLRELRIELASGTLTLRELTLSAPRWQLPISLDGPWIGLHLAGLEAVGVSWQSRPRTGPAAPTRAPADLRLPVALRVDTLRTGPVTADGSTVLQSASASLALSADEGATHRLLDLRVSTDRLSAQGELALDSAAPLRLRGHARLASLPQAPQPWQAEIRLGGTLAALELHAGLAGQPTPKSAAAHAQVEASLHPFDTWPLARLRLDTRELDLHSLHASAPRTRLTAQARLDTPARDQPARLDLQLDNPAAGPWDQQQLPVRRLRASLGVTPATPDRWQLDGLRIDWGPDSAPGGRIEGQGLYQADGPRQGLAQFSGQFSRWRPAALDTRLAAMTLDGSLQLKASGLPHPARWLAPAGAAASAPGARAPGAPTQAAAPDWQRWRADVQLALQGRLDAQAQGATPPVQLRLSGQIGPQQATLGELLAQAGGAQLRADGQWRLQAGQHQLQARLDTQELDPLPWLPGSAEAPWRQGRNRLNLQLQAQASLPAALASGHEPGAWWQALAGQVRLQLAPSQLGGVPLQGDLALDTRGGQVDGSASLDLAGNQLRLSRPSTAGAAPGPWQLNLDARRLPALAPLLAWVPASGRALAQAYWPTEAEVSADASLDALPTPGHWTAHLAVNRWRSARLSLESGRVNLHGAPGLEGQGRLELQGLAAEGARLSRASLDVQGSPARHEVLAELEAPLRPPAWVETWIARRQMTGTRARLQLSGRWLDGEAQAHDDLRHHWQASIRTLSLGALDTPESADWLHASDLSVQLSLGEQGGIRAAQLAPGRIRLPGTALRWREARWQADPAEIAFDGELEPITVAPVLAQLQPDMGWSGDLRVGADLLYRHQGGRTEAEIVLERRSGDLSASDPGQVLTGIQHLPLGLSDMRLAVAARDGRWSFTQALAGRQLGEMAGVLAVESQPGALWPSPQEALSGVVQMRVASLDTWGAWVPAGWRLAGTLSATAQFGGTLADPQITGQMAGERLGVRHVLQGVHVSDGELLLRFEGEQARIERGEFRAGQGSLSLSGQAKLGQQPEAELSLTARQFQVLGRLDRKLVASGDARLSWRSQILDLRGALKVDEGLFDFSRSNAPTLDDDVIVLDKLPDGPGGAAGSRPAAGRNPAAPAKVSLSVDLGSQLALRGRGLEAVLRGTLLISTTADGRPHLVGQVRAERGTYAAYGQKLEVDRGLITFTGPAEDPRLDIFAIRSGLDIKVGVTVTGTALNPRVRLASDPEMTDTERLSWLLLGRASEGLAQADTELLQRAALALLMGEGEGVTDTLIRNLGLTDLSLRQETDGDVRATVVSVGKQLSRRWYVGYERSVNATTGTWQLIYRAAQRVTVRLQSGEDRSLDLIWTWRWN